MHTLTLVTTAVLLFNLSGCQTLQRVPQKSDHTARSAMNPATPPEASALRNFWTRQFSQSSIRDYPAACLGHSKLQQPMVVGQVIDTPRYAMITLAKQQQQAQVMGGELCIINKVSHHVEITAVDDLRFVAPVSGLPASRSAQ